MSGASPSPDEVEDAAKRAGAEASLKPSVAMMVNYTDLLVRRGYLTKKRSRGEDRFRPTIKFGNAWADATVTVVSKGDPELVKQDPIGAIAIQMSMDILGLDRSSLVKGRNPEELARLAGVLVAIGRRHFGPEFFDEALAEMKDELGQWNEHMGRWKTRSET
jgi:hypothetical protein